MFDAENVLSIREFSSPHTYALIARIDTQAPITDEVTVPAHRIIPKF